MGYPLRTGDDGSLFHVTARGNNGRTIYTDSWDRCRFLGFFSRAVARCGWLCHSFCLMGNHYHVLLETPTFNLSRGIQYANGMYARAFNRRHERQGHLFRARFHSERVVRDAHLLEAARYIVLNPVRAGLCAYPEDWPWSSHRAMCGTEPPPAFLSTAPLLREFSDDLRLARGAYERFVHDRLNQRRTR